MTYQHDDYAAEFKARAGEWWQQAVAFASDRGPAPQQPYQVEIHPSLLGAPTCLLRCVDCHGQFLRSSDGLEKVVYLQLLDDLAGMGVPVIVFSGAYSDPSTDGSLLISLLDRAGPRWGVRLHTYGLGLSEQVRQSILRAATVDPTGQSYLTISKVTAHPDVYGQMCRPRKLSAVDWLHLEEHNLRQLFSEAEGVPITLRVNCRLTQINGTVKSVAGLLRWFEATPERVQLRFTTDYMPTNAPAGYRKWFNQYVYLPPAKAKYHIEQAIAVSGFHSLERIGFRDAEAAVYSGVPCHNSLLFSAVSTSGGVFPCQGIASKVFQHLSYGDLNVERFPAVWQRFTEQYRERSLRPCPKCVAACERQINQAFQRDLL